MLNQSAIESLLQTVVANQTIQQAQLDRIETSLQIVIDAAKQHGERLTVLERRALGNGSSALNG